MLATILALLYALLMLGTAFADTFPGGFIEPQGQFTRTKYTAAQIAAFMPASRIAFNFPAPYNTRGVRLTVPADCGGQDCLYYVGYSYWANMNNHVNDSVIKIFLNFSPSFGGDGPNLITYNKNTETVTKVGPLFPPGSPWRTTSDGSTTWYWSGSLQNEIYMLDFVDAALRRKLLRFNTASSSFSTVFDLLNNFPGCTVSSCPFRLWQAHSSADDTVHSFTVQDNFSAPQGCLVYQPNRTPAVRFYAKLLGSEYDECDIDKSGHYTLIREFSQAGNSLSRVNRFFDNWTGAETRITNFAHTLGHHASGYGYFIGLGDPENLPGSVFYYLMNPFGRGAVQHYDANWDYTMMNHPTHVNSINGASLSAQMFCGSNVTSNSIRNEIGCSRMDDSHRDLIVAPVMTDPASSGGRFATGVGDGFYGRFPKGNIDISGRYFIWTTNLSGSRLDAFLVKIPSQLFDGNAPLDVPAGPSREVVRVPGAKVTPAPRGFTLTFFDGLEAAMLLWGLFKQRARLIWAYRKAGEAAFKYYWQWKIKRWLKAAPSMIQFDDAIEMTQTGGKSYASLFIRHEGNGRRY